MLASARKNKAVEIFLSISFEHEVFRAMGELLLLVFQIARPWKFEFSVASEKLSQFAHFRRACKEVWAGELARVKDTWVIFTDDDDLWSGNRYFFYLLQILALSDRGQDYYDQVTSVAYLRYKDKEGKLVVRDPSDDWGEFWMYAVPLRYLHQFLDNTSDIIINCKFADMFFLRFIRYEHPGKTMCSVPIDDDEFLYHYRRSEKQELCDASRFMEIALEQFMLALFRPHIMPIEEQTDEETKQRTFKGVINDEELDEHFREYYLSPPPPWMDTRTLSEQREAYVKRRRDQREVLKNELKQVAEGVTLLKVTPTPM